MPLIVWVLVLVTVVLIVSEVLPADTVAEGVAMMVIEVTSAFGPGQYRFTDCTRVGAALKLIFWILGTLLIPVLWPL